MSNLKRKELWTEEAEQKLWNAVQTYGPGDWETIARHVGKTANSCRLKWKNLMKPGIKRGGFTDQELLLLLELRFKGNGWAAITKEFPGRVDNDIKNFWNTHLKKEAKELKCDVNGEEFFKKMTARLTERIQQSYSTDVPSGSGDQEVWDIVDDVAHGRLILGKDCFGFDNCDQSGQKFNW